MGLVGDGPEVFCSLGDVAHRLSSGVVDSQVFSGIVLCGAFGQRSAGCSLGSIRCIYGSHLEMLRTLEEEMPLFCPKAQ